MSPLSLGRTACAGLGTRVAASLRVAALVLMTAAFDAAAAEPATTASDGVLALQELRTFATTGRVLHVGAHPDDENTELIAYLSRGRGYDTAYLSVTRGDGGQNLLGSDFDEKLGLARTNELMAARRIDGGRQFFSRAIDFGFSKNPEETLSIWNHREVLGDVVRIIRQFRPDVIVTRFPIPPGSGGHGHHTASAILAVEAFKIAGDPTAYPEHAKEGLAPWQPKRILWNSGRFFRSSTFDDRPSFKVEITGGDPVTNESFLSIAARSRSMHKTQGLGDFASRAGSGPREETFVLLGGEPAQKDLMDGVDPTWARVEGGSRIGELAQAAVSAFKVDDPAASVPALLALRRELAALKSDTIVTEKRTQLDRVLRRCLGLETATHLATATVVPGESLDVALEARVKAPTAVTWVAVRQGGVETRPAARLEPGKPATRSLKLVAPADVPVTQPYWLRETPQVGMYQVSDPKLIGVPLNPPALPVEYVFDVDGQTLNVTDEPTYVGSGTAAAVAAPVIVVPRVSLRFDAGVAVFRPGATKTVTVELSANRPGVKGTVQVQAPAGWKVSAPQPFALEKQHDRARVTFELVAPAGTSTGAIAATALVDGKEWKTDGVELRYEHLPLLVLQPPARKKITSITVETKGRSIGYVPGAGDDVPEALKQLGYSVTTLAVTDLTPEKLKAYDAVVVGVRAFNTRPEVAPALPALFGYAEAGGTVIEQYNWERNLKISAFAPFPVKLSASRITDETAKVTFLAPDHPVLNAPNKIGPADFDGWVQERGVYFPTEWDEHFTAILSMADPGEAPLKGSLLVASVGKGHFVYTSLAFFRQLPAGVPGAYRLFANLVSLGK